VSDAPPVAIRQLVKRYGDLVAVDHVDLTVGPGDVYGFLGPNGAGKTTTLRMLLGLIRPTAGRVELFGRDPLRDGARALADLDGGGARGRVEDVLGVVELRDRGDDKVGGYSHGMRQRLGIAASLLREPRLLLLDEPTTGLDPAGMRDMRELVKRLASQGITILLSSHILAEVEELCNSVAIVRKGRIVYEGALAELLRGAGGGYRLDVDEPERARTLLLNQPGITAVALAEGEVRFQGEPDAVAAASIALGRAGIGIRALVPHTATLEELFLGLTEAEAAA